ncbi:MAG: hypothetical protein EOP49_11270 [Sphingobacteriales bacterium]|nr:MAG: hypothetical protein EOP49_11270 [Sphingobacteriales bacterium]
MKSILVSCLMIASLPIAHATKKTKVEVRYVYGKNIATIVNGSDIKISCVGNTPKCYDVITTTTTERTVIEEGDEISITVYDENGENPQIARTGEFRSLEVTTLDNGVTQHVIEFAD